MAVGLASGGVWHAHVPHVSAQLLFTPCVPYVCESLRDEAPSQGAMAFVMVDLAVGWHLAGTCSCMC